MDNKEIPHIEASILPDTQPAVSHVLTPASPKKIQNIAKKILASDSPLEFIDTAGIDLLEIYKELYKIALEASTTSLDKYGGVQDLGPDNRARIMAATLLLELAKHIKDKSVVAVAGVFNDEKVVVDAQNIVKKYSSRNQRVING